MEPERSPKKVTTLLEMLQFDGNKEAECGVFLGAVRHALGAPGGCLCGPGSLCGAGPGTQRLSRPQSGR